MGRRFPLLVVVAALVAIVVWALIPKRDPGAPPPALLEEYTFANKLPEVHPPLTARRPEVLADPVLRTAERIEWGPPDVFYWSARHLPDDRDAVARAILAKLPKIVIGSPLQAQRLIDALAVLAQPVARDELMRIAESPPQQNADFLQIAALRALAKYPRDDEIRQLFARLSNSPLRSVKEAAIAEVVRSDVVDANDLNGFLEVYTGAQAIPFLQQVATRGLAGCANAVAEHLDSQVLRERQTAILALLVLDDPRGAAAAAEELEHDEDAGRLEMALSLYRDAKRLPPLERARQLSISPSGPVRRGLVDALGPWGPEEPREGAIQLLRVLAADDDPVVKQAAILQLWRQGRTEAAEPKRDELRRAHGDALREAAQFLCDTLRDPQSASIIRQRFATETLNGVDQANLLGGLRHVGGAEDVPLYVERILRGGTNDDVRGSERTYLSEYASLYVQTLGKAAVAPLAQALDRASNERVRLELLDALRGTVKGADPDAARAASDRIFALLLDPAQSMKLRREAADTICYFDDPALGARLYALRDKVGDKALADRIIDLYASFF